MMFLNFDNNILNFTDWVWFPSSCCHRLPVLEGCSAAVTTKESRWKRNRTKIEIVELHTTIQIKICTALLNSKSQNQLTNKLEIFNKSQSNKIDTWCSQKIHMTYMVQDDDLKKIKQNAVPEKWIFSTDRTS